MELEWIEEEGDELLPDVSDLEPVPQAAPKRELDPDEALARLWGYDRFRPYQREAVDAALERRDCLVILPTGGGKSLCYQVPAACRPGMVLVVSPLIALMDDQVAAAQQVGIKAGALHSGRQDDERRRCYAQALNGELDLLYVSPERLCVGGGELLAQIAPRLALVAVDEAHCISHWGHDFRPEYRQLAPLLDRYADIPRMGLTATATPQVQEDICRQLGLREPLRLVGHPDRPNLVYRCLARKDAKDQILSVIKRHPGEGGIVYAQTRKTVERLAEQLRKAGVDAAPYHAGLPAQTRSKAQADFVAERLDVVVATIAFGMGIDRSNVRYVIHANTPRSIEHYQQESGRAGRDGLPADCVLLFAGGDLSLHRQLALSDGQLEPDRRRALETQLAEIGRFAIAPVCRHQLLAEHFGFAPETEAGTDGCGACDVCLGETTELPADEALIIAQKIISAVWRTGARFGTGHVVDVLMGRSGERIKRLGHDQLSVHGLLKEAGDHPIKAWIDQLIVQDLLRMVDSSGYPILGLSDPGIALCKGEGQVRLSKIEDRGSSGGSRSRKAKQLDEEDWADVDRDCFEHLRALRRQLAERQGVPPYVIFGDTALRAMASAKPSDEAGLLAVKGVGESKLARYGQAFLAAIKGAEVDDAAALVGS